MHPNTGNLLAFEITLLSVSTADAILHQRNVRWATKTLCGCIKSCIHFLPSKSSLSPRVLTHQ